MKTLIVSVLFLLLGNIAFTQNAELKNYQDTSKHDTIRAKAFIGYIWNNFLFSDTDSAQVLSDELIEFTKKSGYEKWHIRALNVRGIVHDLKGEYKLALSYFFKSLSLLDTTNFPEIATDIHTNIGIVYNNLNEPEKSKIHVLKSLKFAKAAKYRRAEANAYNNLGLYYENIDSLDMAGKYFWKAYLIREELRDTFAMAMSLINCATVMDPTNPEMEKLTLKGLEFAATTNYDFAAIIGNQNLSEIYFKRKNYNESIKYAQKSYELAEKANLKDNQKFSALQLYKAFKAKGKFSKALTYYEEYISINDSLLGVEKKKEILEQEYQFELAKQQATDSVKRAKQQEINYALVAKEKAEKEKAKSISRRNETIIYFGIALLVVVLFFVFMIAKSLKLVKKQKQIVDDAYTQLEEKNKEILDSISYAKRIQSAILPPQKLVKSYLKESFILYKPKDIVAGDFYWLEASENAVLFAAADCTGHGVPGAMVSVVCNNGLNRAVREFGLEDPGKILDKTREIVIKEFEKSEEEVKDGMDIALCSLKIPFQKEEEALLSYAGANNPLWIIRKNSNEVEEIKANKQPIGKMEQVALFKTEQIKLNKGDSFYLFSDGYTDQFGGERGKKFKSANFKKLLLSIQSEGMEKQKELLDEAFENWKGSIEQLDDVCVIGVKI